MTVKRKLTRQFDQVWGEDRYLHSPYYGEVTEHIIILWSAPGLSPVAVNMTGVLAHGSFVQVINRAKVRDRLWYKVTGRSEYKGKVYPQVGWVSERMLRKRGRDAFNE